MSEMIERAARASFDFWKARQPGKEDLQFEQLNNLDGEMEFALAHAKAIIEAMREPTEEMVEAGWDGMEIKSIVTAIYGRMINEALK